MRNDAALRVVPLDSGVAGFAISIKQALSTRLALRVNGPQDIFRPLRRLQVPQPALDEGILERLKKYHWPGNVRELRHAIERCVIMSDQGVPQVDGLLPAPHSAAAPATLNLHTLEKEAILKAVEQHQGNLSKAAQALGLGRTTLYRKMLRHGIQ